MRLRVTNSLSSLVIVLWAPVRGAIADAGGPRKTFLFVFASHGILSTASLYGVSQGAWLVAACAGMSLDPDLFGLENAGEAVRVAFLLVALRSVLFREGFSL